MIMEESWSLFIASLTVLTFSRVRVSFENLLEFLDPLLRKNAHDLKFLLIMLRDPLKPTHRLSRSPLAGGWATETQTPTEALSALPASWFLISCRVVNWGRISYFDSRAKDYGRNFLDWGDICQVLLALWVAYSQWRQGAFIFQSLSFPGHLETWMFELHKLPAGK